MKGYGRHKGWRAMTYMALNGKNRGTGWSLLSNLESEHMTMWRQKTQEERKMLDEFRVSRSSFGLTVIQTPITLCNKLSPLIPLEAIVFKQQSFDNYTQFMSWQCGSSDVGWLRLESPFIHESILCKGRELGLAGWPGLTSADMFFSSLYFITQQACAGLFSWLPSKIQTWKWSLEDEFLQLGWYYIQDILLAKASDWSIPVSQGDTKV